MSRTRRVGRKYQVRKLITQVYNSVNYPHPEIINSLNQARDEKLPLEELFFPYQLTPIFIERDFPNPNSVPLLSSIRTLLQHSFINQGTNPSLHKSLLNSLKSTFWNPNNNEILITYNLTFKSNDILDSFIIYSNSLTFSSLLSRFANIYIFYFMILPKSVIDPIKFTGGGKLTYFIYQAPHDQITNVSSYNFMYIIFK